MAHGMARRKALRMELVGELGTGQCCVCHSAGEEDLVCHEQLIQNPGSLR